MSALTGDMPQLLKLLIALATVLALMGGLAFIMKKLGLAAERNIKSGKKRRLSIVESVPLDARRRLVILQCDKKQHLVILGPNSETVLDGNLETVDCSEDSDSST